MHHYLRFQSLMGAGIFSNNPAPVGSPSVDMSFNPSWVPAFFLTQYDTMAASVYVLFQSLMGAGIFSNVCSQVFLRHTLLSFNPSWVPAFFLTWLMELWLIMVIWFQSLMGAGIFSNKEIEMQLVNCNHFVSIPASGIFL